MQCKHLVGKAGTDVVPIRMFPAKHGMYLKQIDQFNLDQKTKRGRIPTPPMHFTYFQHCPNCGAAIDWQTIDGNLVPCVTEKNA